MKRWMLILTLLGATGCRNDVQTSLWEQNKTLSETKTELTLEAERLRQENALLAGQVSTLSGIEAGARAAVVPQTVRIGRHSGLYDKTNDGSEDSLVVYVEPVDANQDVIKAAGSVQVELWNLGVGPENARLAAWEVGAEALKGQWGRGLLGAYYRLTFPLEGVVLGDRTELTVRVRFIDYLTGKTLTDQHVITRR